MAEYSIRDIAKLISIAGYKLMETLPKQLAERLVMGDPAKLDLNYVLKHRNNQCILR